MELKISKIDSLAKIPFYSKDGDCGLDLSSIKDYVVEPKKRILVETGIKMEIPLGFFGSIRDRSGLAVKNGISIMAGVVDSGYRGEIKVSLINLGEETFIIKKGDRIAQMIIQPYELCEIKEVENIGDTLRGESGFGSTGLN